MSKSNSMSGEHTPLEIGHEEEIVWLVDDPAMLEYVRHELSRIPDEMRRKYGRPRALLMCLRRLARQLPGEVVGYAFSNQSNRFRVFWLKRHDRYFEPEGTYRNAAPGNSVAAQTIAPGANGHMTKWIWEGSERKRCEVRRVKARRAKIEAEREEIARKWEQKRKRR